MSIKLANQIQTATTVPFSPIIEDTTHIAVTADDVQEAIDELSKAVKSSVAAPTTNVLVMSNGKLKSTVNSVDSAEVDLISSNISNSLKTGTDSKLFNDISGKLVKSVICKNTTTGVIDFSKPKSQVNEQGKDFWEYTIEGEDITLETLPIGYSYLLDTDIHFHIFNFSGKLVQELMFQFNPNHPGAVGINNNSDNQIDITLPINNLPTLDFNFSGKFITTNSFCKPITSIKIGINNGTSSPSNFNIEEVAFITNVHIIKNTDLVFQTSTKSLNN